MSEPDIDIKDLVEAIRTQLEDLDAARVAANKPVLFELKGLDLELNFTVERKGSVKGGVDLKIVSLGGQGEIRGEEVQKITLHWSVRHGTIDTLGRAAIMETLQGQPS